MARLSAKDKNSAILKRTLSLPFLTLYGLGTILGAGIYVLIGEVAGAAGMLAPLAFLVAAIVAGITGLSYAELSSRVPRSAGEAAYLQEAFKKPLLSGLAGWGVVCTGVISAATVAHGFVGYLNEFVPAQRQLTIVITLIALVALAAWGVSQSVGAASIVSVLELGGLLFVVSLSAEHLVDIPARIGELAPSGNIAQISGIVLGGYIAFFAFIGFEDIVNMSEEVKNPTQTVPRAIVISMVVATLLYMLVALIAVLALPIETLAESPAPLADVLASRGSQAKVIITAISLVAIINGALIQIIMASRVLYGMAGQGIAPSVFARVAPRTQTPLIATVVVGAMVLALALTFPQLTLAKLTSAVTLFVFALVNTALIRIKSRARADDTPRPPVCVPYWVPWVGVVLCAGFLVTTFTLSSLH